MHQRTSQISGLKPRHIGQNRRNFVNRHQDGDDWRRSIVWKRVRQISNLGKSGMGVEIVEGRKPLLPIRQAAQHKKAWCRSNCGQPRGIINRMASRTFCFRQAEPQNHVTAQRQVFNLVDLFGRQSKEGSTIGGKSGDRAQAHIGMQPFRQAIRAIMPFAAALDMPKLSRTLNQNAALAAKFHIRLIGTGNELNLDLGFQRKARQDVLEQAGFHQAVRRIQPNQTIFCCRTQRQRKQHQYEQNPMHAYKVGRCGMIRQRVR